MGNKVSVHVSYMYALHPPGVGHKSTNGRWNKSTTSLCMQCSMSALPLFFLLSCCRHKKVSIRRLIIIRTARIPIIKVETNSNVVADISLGDSGGPKAANYVAQQVCDVLLLSTC